METTAGLVVVDKFYTRFFCVLLVVSKSFERGI